MSSPRRVVLNSATVGSSSIAVRSFPQRPPTGRPRDDLIPKTRSRQGGLQATGRRPKQKGRFPRRHLLGDSVNKFSLKMHRGSQGGIITAVQDISPEKGGREERPYVCRETPPTCHVLRLNLRAHMVGCPIRRLYSSRPAPCCPHRDPPHPGLGGTARAWLPDDPLACEVVLVRSGHRTSACGPPHHRGTERRARGGCPVARRGWLLIHHPPGVRGAPGQPPGRADGRGTGMAWLRLARSAGRPLTAVVHPYPRAAGDHLACAPLLLRGRLAAVRRAGWRPGAVRVYVRGQLALQPHRRQRAHDYRSACHRREHPNRATLERRRGSGADELALRCCMVRRGNRVSRLGPAVLA